MIEQERIDRARAFLGGWYRCYADLVASVPANSDRSPSQHNIECRNEYRNAIEVIEGLATQVASLRAKLLGKVEA